MAFRFYIDNQLTDQPVNDTALSTSIKRDSQLNALLVTQDVELVYNGNNDLLPGEVSGYTLLKTAFDAGSCEELPLTIYDGNTLHYVGVIKVPQISIDEQRILASSKVQDNSFYSYVNNNKNIAFNIKSTQTKNREPIAACQVYEVDMFNSATGIYGSTYGFYYRGYRVYDVFKYLVAALSDNKVGFESYYLQGDSELFLFDGFALQNYNTAPNVLIAFEKLFKEITKARNISFYIDTTDQNNPVLRLESFPSLFSGVQVLTFEDILQLKTRIRTDRIYGTIKVGADYNPGGSIPFIFTFNAGTSYLGWMEEIYAPLGQCNVDNEFNLVSEFIITSNAIQDQVHGGVSGYDDSLFLVECESVDTVNFTAIATQYDAWAAASTAKYYNEGLNNPAKLLVHASNFQTGLSNTLEIGGNGFRASLGQELLLGTFDPSSPANAAPPGYLIDPVVYADETTGNNYDGGGNYDFTTGIYVAPLDGNYSFTAKFILDVVNVVICPGVGIPGSASVGFFVSNSPTLTGGSYPSTVIWGFVFRTFISVYTDNTLTTLVSTTQVTNKVMQNFNQAPLVVNSIVNLTTGQAVVVQSLVIADWFAPDYFGNLAIKSELNQLPGWDIFPIGCTVGSAKPAIYASLVSYFSCTGGPDGGGITVDNDPALYKSKEVEFTYAIPNSDWELIKASPTGQFLYEKDGVTRYGWIQEMQRNDWTGQTNIKLISEEDATT